MTNTASAATHIAVATVRNAERKIVEVYTLCDSTIVGEDLAVGGVTTCQVCITRDAL